MSMPVSMMPTRMPVPSKPSSLWTTSEPVIVMAVNSSGSMVWASGCSGASITPIGKTASTTAEPATLSSWLSETLTATPFHSAPNSWRTSTSTPASLRSAWNCARSALIVESDPPRLVGSPANCTK